MFLYNLKKTENMFFQLRKWDLVNGKDKYTSLDDCVIDACNGVDGAFDALYAMSYPYAYKSASALLNHREDMEDALQNSFYNVYRHISELKDHSSYLKWLNTIVINECRKILIEQNKRKKIFTTENSRLLLKAQEEAFENERLEKDDSIAIVTKLIDEMKPEKREILKLFYFDGLSYSEISKALNIPIGTVMSRLHNAKKELEKKVKQLQKDGTILWGLPAIPLVTALLSYNVKAKISSSMIARTTDSILSASASAAASSGTAGGAGAAAAGTAGIGTATAVTGTSLTVKAVAVAIAASVAVGGGITTKTFLEKRNAEAGPSETNTIYNEETKNYTEEKTVIDIVSNDHDLFSSSEPDDETTLLSRIESTGTIVSTQKEKKTAGSTKRSKETVTVSKSDQEEPTIRDTSTTENVRETSATVTTSAGPPSTTEKASETTSKRPETTKDPSAGLSVTGGVLDGYSGSGGSVDIPSTINGQKVTAIGAGAFEGANISSVSIPSGVTKIGQMSFSDCSKLSSVSLPSDLISIGDCAFDGCSSLKSITIPDSVTSIGDNAFDGCDDLTIRCSNGSAAHEYAIENNIKFDLV